MSDHSSGDTRRGFFKKAGVGLVAAGAATAATWVGVEAGAEPTLEQKKKAIKAEYRTLGKIGKKVAKIGLGTASLTAAGPIDRAIDMGLNYIDTAYIYGDGRSERTLGKILKKRRDEVVLTTKWPPRPGATKASMLEKLDTSLKRLNVDHVDVVMVHSVSDPKTLQNPAIFEAFEAAKKAGKVSHLGMSSHATDMIKVVDEAIKLKRYEIVLMKYSFMAYPKLDPLIDKLHAAGIAITVMKTRDGARHVNLEKYQKDDGHYAAAIRWASANPKVASTVISVETYDDIDKVSKVAGTKLAARDMDLLHQYAAEFGEVQCRWCGECKEGCPNNVPVWDVDRAEMYYTRYGNERRGMDLYADLGEPASACARCDAPCESSCGFNIPIREQMMEAHATLSWGRKPSNT